MSNHQLLALSLREQTMLNSCYSEEPSLQFVAGAFDDHDSW